MRHFESVAINHLWGPVSMVLSLTILFSCGHSESQKAELASIDTIQFKNASGVPASPARVAIPLPLPDNRITSTYILRSNGRADTVVIYEDSYDPNSRYGLKWVKEPGALYNLKGINGSNNHVIARSKLDSSYVFLYASKPMKIDNDSIWALTILVCKNHEIVSENTFQTIDLRIMTLSGLENHTYSLDGVDECFAIGYGRSQCGYGAYSALFMLKGDKIIEGLKLFTDGESVTDESKFVSAQTANQIWVERSMVLYGMETPIVYFTEILKYAVAEDGTKLLNPKNDNFQYINVQTGVSLLTQPVTQSPEQLQSLESEESIEEEASKETHEEFTVKFGERVNVLNKTAIPYKVKRNGKIVSGNWVYVEYNYVYQGLEQSFRGFVFDRNLSAVKPQK
jgi:hypothetical protein